MAKKIKVGVLGATGLTGGEIVSLLLRHGGVDLAWLSSESQSGADYAEIFPQFHKRLPEPIRKLKNLAEVQKTAPEVVFSCLPHGASANCLGPFLNNGYTKIVDLSADFRLRSKSLYEKIYGVKHPHAEFLEQSLYGLCEIRPDEISGARLIGNPGCYPTSVLLPLFPLLRERVVSPSGIIIDAKSGVSGAGKKPTETTHFIYCNESIHAYKVGDQHRHVSEMEEQLTLAAGSEVSLLFTPHLIPMERGILSTIYCDLADGADDSTAVGCLREYYHASDFVHIREDFPRTADVRGGNECHIKVYQPAGKGKLIIVSVIDNMIKGASGQAVQNMNLTCGFPQIQGLR